MKLKLDKYINFDNLGSDICEYWLEDYAYDDINLKNNTKYFKDFMQRYMDDSLPVPTLDVNNCEYLEWPNTPKVRFIFEIPYIFIQKTFFYKNY